MEFVRNKLMNRCEGNCFFLSFYAFINEKGKWAGGIAYTTLLLVITSRPGEILKYYYVELEQHIQYSL